MNSPWSSQPQVKRILKKVQAKSATELKNLRVVVLLGNICQLLIPSLGSKEASCFSTALTEVVGLPAQRLGATSSRLFIKLKPHFPVLQHSSSPGWKHSFSGRAGWEPPGPNTGNSHGLPPGTELKEWRIRFPVRKIPAFLFAVLHSINTLIMC